MGSLFITVFEFILVLSCTISKKVSAEKRWPSFLIHIYIIFVWPFGSCLISIFGACLAFDWLVAVPCKNIPDLVAFYLKYPLQRDIFCLVFGLGLALVVALIIYIVTKLS
jgi:hypothetical protein